MAYMDPMGIIIYNAYVKSCIYVCTCVYYAVYAKPMSYDSAPTLETSFWEQNAQLVRVYPRCSN
jgi:hypothetical protein